MGFVGRFGEDLQGFWRVSVEIFTILYQIQNMFVDFLVLLQPMLQNGVIWWDILGYARICWDMLGYAGICWDMLGCVGYVGIW